jgi:hypothetical protein
MCLSVRKDSPYTDIAGSRPFIPTVGQPTAADNNNEPYVPYYRYLLSRKNQELPQVISNSYGDQEDVSKLIIPSIIDEGRSFCPY